jgi:hypothetical protein
MGRPNRRNENLLRILVLSAFHGLRVMQPHVCRFCEKPSDVLQITNRSTMSQSHKKRLQNFCTQTLRLNFICTQSRMVLFYKHPRSLLEKPPPTTPTPTITPTPPPQALGARESQTPSPPWPPLAPCSPLSRCPRRFSPPALLFRRRRSHSPPFRWPEWEGADSLSSYIEATTTPVGGDWLSAMERHRDTTAGGELEPTPVNGGGGHGGPRWAAEHQIQRGRRRRRPWRTPPGGGK